jgi:inhibitor of KinA
MDFTINPLSDDAILLHFGQNNPNLKVQNAIQQIEQYPFIGFRELVPAYDTLTIYYNPFIVSGSFPYEKVKNHLETILSTPHSTATLNRRYFEIPVCYEGEFALDLKNLAENNNISVQEAIHLHTNVVYDVIFIGFSPGFPFLAGLNEKLHCPRKTSPRLKVHQGSVGIAGKQTGIYSLDSPGGWQIIGRTPVKLFNVTKDNPTLLKSGDQVKFYPISQTDFYLWEEQLWE